MREIDGGENSLFQVFLHVDIVSILLFSISKSL